MKIQALRLKNFKGIANLELNFDSKNASIMGDNATGKTTLFDAFCYILFDKNSLNQKDFGIKTLNADGEPIHMLEHEVEVTFAEPSLKLRKLYKEDWTKKRSSAEATFSGHTVEYFVNDVPSKKKEYTDKIASVVSEDIFKLLSSPLYFNTQLHWQDRRKLLLSICGDVADNVVISKNLKLIELESVLSNRTLDDHKKVVASKLSEFNKELDKIPTRIDEVRKSIEDTTNFNLQDLKEAIATLEQSKKIKQDELSLIENGGQASVIKKQVAELEAEMQKLKNTFEQKKAEVRIAQHKRFMEFSKEHSNKNIEIINLDASIEIFQKGIANKVDSLEKLRAEFTVENKKEFTFSHDDNCPTCKQALPSEHIESVRQKALEQFNTAKSKILADINIRGKNTKETMAADIANLNNALKKKETLAPELEALASKKSDSEYVFDDDTKIEESPEYVKLSKNRDSLLLETQTTDNSTTTENIKLAIAKLDQEIREINGNIAKLDATEKAKTRELELRAEEKRLSAEHQEWQKQQYLCEEFIKSKVAMITDNINSKFRLAKFRLFETQINGGLNEVCESVYDGVPYSDLNNAMKINLGLDIINTLSTHYGVSVPVFIDNAESVTKLENVDTQVISLVVSEKDKVLRMELENKLFAVSA